MEHHKFYNDILSYGFGTVKPRPLPIVYRFMAAFATSLQITFFPNKKVGQKRPQAFLTHK